jgi:hypothetical protein
MESIAFIGFFRKQVKKQPTIINIKNVFWLICSLELVVLPVSHHPLAPH